MTIDSTTATSAALSSSASVQATHQHHRHGGGKSPFDSVSKLLDMSTSDIEKAVSSGTSLDDLAKSKGVSHDDLIAALKAGAPKALQGTSQLDSVVEDIATRTGKQGPLQGPPPGPPPGGTGVMSGTTTDAQKELLDSLSKLLGTTSDDLSSQLQSGANLGDLLQAKGVSLDDVASSLQSGFLVDVKA